MKAFFSRSSSSGLPQAAVRGILGNRTPYSTGFRHQVPELVDPGLVKLRAKDIQPEGDAMRGTDSRLKPWTQRA